MMKFRQILVMFKFFHAANLENDTYLYQFINFFFVSICIDHINELSDKNKAWIQMVIEKEEDFRMHYLKRSLETIGQVKNGKYIHDRDSLNTADLINSDLWTAFYVVQNANF